jgi:hypothetical protein
MAKPGFTHSISGFEIQIIWRRSYLAAELLDIYETSGDQAFLSVADSIFANEEPDLRRLPMIRYFFGAFDRLDDSLSLLRSRELIQITGVKNSQKVQETDFLLADRGGTILHYMPRGSSSAPMVLGSGATGRLHCR